MNCSDSPIDLQSFTIKSVLDEDPRSKTLTLLLQSTSNPTNSAIYLLEKAPFDTDSANNSSLLASPSLLLLEANDIYYRFTDPPRGYHSKLIYPATSNHISKYTSQIRHLLPETADQHRQYTRPYFERLKSEGRTLWIDNIINGSAEQDRIIHKSNEFIILPDSKWTGERLQELYFVILFTDNSLLTIRDLRHLHLNSLHSIKSTLKSIFTFDGPYAPLSYSQLRIYFHYPPTYPHLHLHVTVVASENSAGAAVGQAHLLDDVIDNLERYGDNYYAERTLTMQVGEQQELYDLLIS